MFLEDGSGNFPQLFHVFQVQGLETFRIFSDAFLLSEQLEYHIAAWRTYIDHRCKCANMLQRFPVCDIAMLYSKASANLTFDFLIIEEHMLILKPLFYKSSIQRMTYSPGIRPAPWGAVHESPQELYASGYHPMLRDHLLSVLRTRRMMTAVTIGKEVTQRAVIRGQSGLIEGDERDCRCLCEIAHGRRGE